MSTPYAGAIVFPTSFLIPDDGDAETAASINVALEALGDRTAYLGAKSPRMRLTPFTESGTYTPSAASRIVTAWIFGVGGGGAGGNGSVGPTSVDRWIAGAGGGGGAIFSSRPVLIVPGTTYNIDIGDGGAPGALMSANGGDGGDTIFRSGATNLAVFPGAAGGDGAVGTSGSPGGGVTLGAYHFSLGGPCRRDTPKLSLGLAGRGIRYDPTSDTAFWGNTGLATFLQLGQGGFGAGGFDNPPASIGAPNPHGRNTGGAAGARGADVATSQRGGGGGGGGGAGPFGDGGDAGNGGDGNAVGNPGIAALDNSGAGGGGGGSGGYHAVSGLVGGLGGAGGSGRLYIVTVEESP